MSRITRNIVLAVAASFAVSAGSIAGASLATNGAGSEIHACVQQPSGNTRIVAGPEACRNSESATSWNRTGPAGPQGPQGPRGAQGPGFEFVNISATTGQIFTQTDGAGAIAGTKAATGLYFVEYDHDLTFCPRYVVIASVSGPRFHTEGQAVVPGDPTSPSDPGFAQRRMVVHTYGPDGSAADTAFTLHTQCP